MFRTFKRLFSPNPFDQMLKKLALRGKKKILLGWNRGLGDIALGLYAMVHRIRELVPNAQVTFITRENLRDGFSMLQGVETIVDPNWKRGQPAVISDEIKRKFDLVIEKPSPTDWVPWQRGKIVPKLKWKQEHDCLYEKFGLPQGFIYVGVQVEAETNYGLWRNWPIEKWLELFDRLGNVKFLLFGFGNDPKFLNENVIDLRGKTNLFELLSIIKNRCYAVILPDSGISSMVYYLDESFPLRLITLWADPNHGILKQRVNSPNPELIHCPLVGEKRDLATVSVDQVLAELFLANTGCIILAGGQGTRLGLKGPKGIFSVGGKSLFEWICEKVPSGMPVAVMTSAINHDETVEFFKMNQFFGLEVHFFQQEMHESSPNGNGSVFRSFVKAGLADLFARKGIDLITVANVDNPLTEPFDLKLIIEARTKKADVVVQCIQRTSQYPSMGIFVEQDGKKKIVEYTELDGKEESKLAYTGQMAFDLQFFRKIAQVSLPLHRVRKKIGNEWTWKEEQFIFDALQFASRVESVVAVCEGCYAPLKSAENIPVIEKLLGARR